MVSWLTSDRWVLRSSLWLPLLLAAAVRLAAIAAGPAPEIWEYDEIARRLLAGDGYVCTHFDQPQRAYYSGVPYIALTAAAYRLWPDDPKAMLVVHTLLALLLVAVVVRLGERLAGPTAGLVAGVLTALHPALAYYDVRKLHPLGLDSLLTVAPVLLLLRPPSARQAALIGVLLGLGILQRGSLIPFALAALVWTAAAGGEARERTRRAVAMAAAIVITLAPWLYRNQQVFGRPVLVTGNGFRFFIGNLPPSQGSARLASGQDVVEVAEPDLLNVLPALDEAAQDRLFWERGRAFVHAHPAAFAAQVARKLVYFWTWTPVAGAAYARLYLFLYLVYYGAVLLAAGAGAATLYRSEHRRALILILALLLSVSAVHALFYVELRHRWALEPILLLLAAIGITRPPTWR
jgi:4-amino-4-deoxy-L-arabinose transferase-like glycosyltransferase